MATSVTIDLRHVARGLSVPLRQVQVVVELLDEGNTVPFITRYRKDRTGGLDEEQIRQIQARLAKMRMLAERKQTILRSIEAQDKLTEALAKQILAAGTTKRLEDLYLPYKPKKQTLATLARSRGLEPLAREIVEADPACADLDARAADFASPDRQVPTPADALLGAGHILAEQFSERADVRQRLRDILQRSGKLVSTRIGGDPAKAPETAETPETSEPPPQQPAAAAETADQGPPAAEQQPEQGTEAPVEPGTEAPVESGTEAPVESGAEAPAESGAEAPVESSAEAPAEPAAEAPAESGTEAPVESAAEAPAESGAEAPVESSAEAPAEPAAEAPAESGTEAPVESAAEAPAESGAEAPVESSAEAPVESAAEAPADPAAEAGAEQPSESAAAAQAPPPAPTARAVPKKAPDKRKPARPSKRELRKKKADEKKIKAFHDYFDYSEEIKKIPPHRVLAINRGERAKILRVKIESDLEAMHEALDEMLVPPEHPHAEYLRGCARDALSRLILPALEREARRELTDRAEQHAVSVFARNLRNLLLQPPVCDRRVLAVDPGFKSGCKLVALDQFGNVLEHGVIYLIGKPERRTQAQQKVVDLINRFQLSLVVIGNGTACRESEDFFAELITGELKDRGVAYVIVNEAGASVYSTSRLGREEFPNYDATLRGAISIGRRLQDPLSELVKIDAANIGVGLYQHDVKAKHLRTSLDEVVESCVNYVGVDANTASPALLRYVSGLNQLTARRILEHRQQHGPFRNREQLKDVPGLGETTFVQAVGFLKISGDDNPLDATWIHPESYETAARVLAHLECAAGDLADKDKTTALAERVAAVDLDALAGQLEVGSLTLADILSQLARPGRDPREDLPGPVFKQGVLKLEDLTAGMELTGTVLNVVDFGAFVDIGMHDSGLVHVSQLADKFIRDPHEVVAVGDVVKVWVMEVDKERRRVSLTLVQPGTQRPHRPHRRGKPDQEKDRTEGGGTGGGGTGGGGSEGGGSGGGGPRGGQPRRDRESRRPRSGEAPGRKRPPKGKGPPRHKGAPKPGYRPQSRPKPVVPLTDEMKTGKEPMRTFGDLAQFFNRQDRDDDPQPKKKRAADKKAKNASQPVQDETPGSEDAAQAMDAQAPSTDQAAQPAVEETQIAAVPVQPPDDETEKTEAAHTVAEEVPSTEGAAQVATDQTQNTSEPPQADDEQPQSAEDAGQGAPDETTASEGELPASQDEAPNTPDEELKPQD